MFQKTVATSRLTLWATIAYAVAMCLVAGVVVKDMWMQTISMFATTYLMLLLNNIHSIIRIYSRLVSSSFLALTLMQLFLTPHIGGAVVQFLFALHLLFLFAAYQNHRGMGMAFSAFLCIGAISMVFIQILFFVPLLWLLMTTRLQAMSFRNFLATIFGLLLPYWFWFAHALWYDTLPILLFHIESITHFAPLFQGLENLHLLASAVLLLIFGICGAVHFIRNSFLDNIRTRMFFYSLMTVNSGAFLFLILQPCHADYLLPIITICSSPLIAHLFTFARNKVTNIFFIISLIAIAALTVFNTWMQ